MTSPHTRNQTPPRPSSPFDLTTLFKPPPPPLPIPNVPPYPDYVPNLHLHRSLSYPVPPLPPPSNSGARLMALLSSPLSNSNLGILPLPNSVHNSNTLLPVGRRLVGDNVVYDIDGKLKGEVGPPQLEVSPITKYVSDPHLVFGRQIAVKKIRVNRWRRRRRRRRKKEMRWRERRWRRRRKKKKEGEMEKKKKEDHVNCLLFFLTWKLNFPHGATSAKLNGSVRFFDRRGFWADFL